MEHLPHVACATLVLALAWHAGAQTAEPAAEVVIAPFVTESDTRVDLRSQSVKCFEQFAAALARNGVSVARAPQLSEENLRSTHASWAVLGRLSQKEGQFRLELRLLEVHSGDEMRSYFNADQDLQAACSAVEKAAQRIAAFVEEQERSQTTQ